MNFKEIGVPTLKLFVIATVVTVLLFLTNNTTEGKIAENQAQADILSRQEVLPSADGFEEATGTLADGTEFTYFEATNGTGYVFSGSNKGYGGDVVSMIGIDSEGNITGVKVTEQAETAGLGAKWTDAQHTAQFTGKVVADGALAVEKDGGDIVAVAGATITSRAVTADVNNAIDMFNAVTGGAK